MACVEYECLECDTPLADGEESCPKCGSFDVRTTFDEMDDHYDLPDLWNNEEEEANDD
tara:strand:+ start:690 stop:863 length:174 start_codon:yes stop_codon:yes gene_type:complete